MYNGRSAVGPSANVGVGFNQRVRVLRQVGPVQATHSFALGRLVINDLLDSMPEVGQSCKLGPGHAPSTNTAPGLQNHTAFYTNARGTYPPIEMSIITGWPPA